MNRQVSTSLFAVFLCVATVSFHPAAAIGKPYRVFKPGGEDPKEEPAKKTKGRAFASRNNSAVKIYPDVVKRDMHVVAKENEGKEIEFFVFDTEGTLIKNYRLKSKDHIRMTGLTRGKYRYHVFCGDIESAAGEFEIR